MCKDLEIFEKWTENFEKKNARVNLRFRVRVLVYSIDDEFQVFSYFSSRPLETDIFSRFTRVRKKKRQNDAAAFKRCTRTAATPDALH